uniref:Uncharacterized protein n=1 Tax=Zea mays TaxID=4577 RepID=A0A804PHE3_MAIZE
RRRPHPPPPQQLPAPGSSRTPPWLVTAAPPHPSTRPRKAQDHRNRTPTSPPKPAQISAVPGRAGGESGHGEERGLRFARDLVGSARGAGGGGAAGAGEGGHLGLVSGGGGWV